MATNYMYIMILITTTILSTASLYEYPKGCQCFRYSLRCDSANLHKKPRVLASATERLEVKNDNFTVLTAELFSRELQVLIMEYTNTRKIDKNAFRGMERLRTLKIIRGSIETIEPGTFQGLHLLSELSLYKNKLRTLLPGTLQGLTVLRNFNVRHNNLKRLEHDLFRGLNCTAAVRHDLKVHSTLSFTGNKIYTINSNIFINACVFTELILTDNKLHLIRTRMFLGLTQLKSLNLRYNNIQSIEEDAFFSLNNLKFLNLEMNSVHELNSGAFNGLTSLISLNLQLVRIEKFNIQVFEMFKSLSTLTMRHNRITYLLSRSFKTLQKLTVLSFSENRIATVHPGAFEGLERLIDLNLEYNLIKNLTRETFSGLVKLKTLNLQHNQIEFITQDVFKPLKFLTKVLLKANMLTYLDGRMFHEQAKLDILDLAENIFISRSGLLQGVYTKLLDLSISNFSAPAHDKFALQEILQGVKGLQQLHLRGINTSLHSGQFWGFKFRILHLFKNNISAIQADAFKDISGLKTLTLYRNNINSIDPRAFSNLTHLETLQLDRNNLALLHRGMFAELNQLRMLNLKNNKITFIDEGVFSAVCEDQIIDKCKYATSLEHNLKPPYKNIRVTCNISTALLELRILKLSSNRISYIHPSAFIHNFKLKKLSLSSNKLLTLETNFLYLPSLEYLSLAFCNISEIHQHAFRCIAKVSTFDIHGNKINFLYLELLEHLKYLKKLSIKSNPLLCDCKMQELWNWIQTYQVSYDERVWCDNKIHPDKVIHFLNCNSSQMMYEDRFVHEFKVPSIESHEDVFFKYGDTNRNAFFFKQYIEPPIIWFIFTAGVLGNFLLFFALYKSNEICKGHNVYILNLALGDILSLVVNIPLSYLDSRHISWDLGASLCNIFMGVRDISVGVNIFSVVMLSAHRYRLIVKSFSRRTTVCGLSEQNTKFLSVLVVWAVAIGLAFPAFVTAKVDYTCQYTYPDVDYIQRTWIIQLLVYCIIPVCLIGFLSARTALFLKKSVQSIPGEQRLDRQVTSRSRLANTVIVLTVIVCLSYVPNYLLRVLVVWSVIEPQSEPVFYTCFLSYCLFFSISCFNPLAFLYLGPRFRESFNLCLRPCRTREAQTCEGEVAMSVHPSGRPQLGNRLSKEPEKAFASCSRSLSPQEHQCYNALKQGASSTVTMTTTNVFIILIATTILSTASLYECPKGCQCFRYSLRCDSANFHTQPRVLASATERLEVKNDNFTVLTAELFSRELQVLIMEYTNTRKIDRNAFRGMQRLRTLKIIRGSIEIIEPGTFQGLQLLSELSLYKNKLRTLLPGTLQGLTMLRNFNVGYNSLTRLEHDMFQGLNTCTTGIRQDLKVRNILSFIGNKIKQIDLKTFNGTCVFTELVLIQNKLRVLRTRMFLGLTKLKFLSLHYNYIHTIETGAFFGLNNLKFLNLGTNSIHTLNAGAFNGLTSLVALNLHFVRMQKFHVQVFEKLNSLASLKIADNRITYLLPQSFIKLQNLTVLSFAGNRIDIVHSGAFNGLVRLHHLHLEYNRIRNLTRETFSGLVRLETLNLQHNEIEFITPDVFQYLRFLRNISLNANRLTYLDGRMFNEKVRLNSLDLTQNELMVQPGLLQGLHTNYLGLSISNFSVPTRDDRYVLHEILQGVKGLQQLYLIGISTALRSGQFRGFKFEKLHLYSNYIPSIQNDTFIGLPQLRVLKLFGNSISVIDVDAFRGLNDLFALHLNKNRIRILHRGVFAGLNKVTKLDLSKNMIAFIDEGVFSVVCEDEITDTCKYVTSLAHNFTALYNNISCNFSTALVDLKILELSSNQISYIHPLAFIHNFKLRKLALSSNKLLTLETNFLYLPSLEYLSLAFCNISEIHQHTFRCIAKVSIFDIHGNKVKFLYLELLEHLKYLKKLSIKTNPLLCDCKMQELWNWIETYQVSYDERAWCDNRTHPDKVIPFLNCNSSQTMYEDRFVHEFKVPSIESHEDVFFKYGDTNRNAFFFKQYIEPPIIWFIFTAGVLGNILLFFALYKSNEICKGHNVYILNLALGDILSLVVNIPLSYLDSRHISWDLGASLCNIFMGVRDISVGVNIFSVVMLSAHRYRLIVKSFSRRTTVCGLSEQNTKFLSVLVVWAVATGLAFPAFVTAKVDYTCQYTYPDVDYIQRTWIIQLLVYCIIPVCLIGFLSARTALFLKKSVQSIPGEQRLDRQVTSRSRLANTVIVLTVIVCLSYVPNYLLRVLVVWSVIEPQSEPVFYTCFLSYCLFFSISCFNPLAFLYLGPRFRESFIWCLRPCRTREAQTCEGEVAMSVHPSGRPQLGNKLTNRPVKVCSSCPKPLSAQEDDF
ncbi:uncharacterized protein [Periplaneta americana]|uniref:uncharacterized protein n=1 Tax=Periplaneta americana TaxID=6978 RepID=UPI0037E71FA9